MKGTALWTAFVVGILAGAGCKNNNLFGDLHKEGSGDAQSLVADGKAALSKSEFSKADDYYRKALAQDSGNSDALYGQAAAQMGLAGLDVGQLVSNLMTGKSAGGAAPLRNALSQASVGPVQSVTTNADSLLNLINVSALDSALTVVIKNLEKIHLGQSDGKISPNDPSLLINLGLARLLKAVTKPWLAGLLDIREASGKYSVVLTAGWASMDGACPKVENSVYNVAWGYLDLREAALKLNMVSGSTLNNIRDDLNTLFTEYQGDVHPSCPNVPTELPATGPTSDTDGL